MSFLSRDTTPQPYGLALRTALLKTPAAIDVQYLTSTDWFWRLDAWLGDHLDDLFPPTDYLTGAQLREINGVRVSTTLQTVMEPTPEPVPTAPRQRVVFPGTAQPR